MSFIDSILTEMEQEAKATRRLLERTPEDKLTWKPHEKSMSLGELALHIAQIPGFISRMAAVDVFELPEFRQAEAVGREQLLSAFEESLADARRILSGIGPDRVHQEWELRAGDATLMKMPRSAMLRTILMNHYYHHRGQLTVYLRLLGVPLPSVYGPSADENPLATAVGSAGA